jgi:hypothetical protein
MPGGFLLKVYFEIDKAGCVTMMNSTMLSAHRLMMCTAVGSPKMLGKKTLEARRFHAKYLTRKDGIMLV